MSESSLSAILEAILFVASEPLSIKRLSEISGQPSPAVTSALSELNLRLTHGIRLANAGDSYRLVTNPESASIVRQFLDDSSQQELTRPALETLAIIAYRGPVSKSQIEKIRGVASETMLRNLLGRGLITEAGRSPEPGRPQRYAISHAFLAHFGLTSTSDLTPLPKAVDEN